MFDLLKDSNFILGIYSGLTVAVIIFILGKLIELIKKISPIINILTKSKILYIYDNSLLAINALYEDAKDSDIVFGFSYNPSVFTDSKSKMYKLLENNEKCDFRFLASDPDSTFIKEREESLKNFTMSDQIKVSIKLFESKSIKFAKHNEQSRIGFYIFDNSIHLYFRLRGKLSSESQVFRVGKDSILYKCFKEQFEDLWEKYYISQQQKDE